VAKQTNYRPGLLSLSAMLASVAFATPPPPGQNEPEPVGQREKRGAYFPLANRWSNNTVYYTLTNANRETRTAFLAAAREISMHTALRFIERTTEENYIIVSTSTLYGICGSRGGMQGGAQIMLIDPLACFTPKQEVGVMLHEIMHALGIAHEHQRDDHALYAAGSGATASSQTAIDPALAKLGPLDVDSVMIYPNTFRLKPGIQARGWPRNTLSAGDILTINSLYPARQTSPPADTPTLTDNGIQPKITTRHLSLGEHSRAEIIATYPTTIMLAQPVVHLSGFNHLGKKLKEQQLALRVEDVQLQADTGGTTLRITLRTQALRKTSEQNIYLVVDMQARNAQGDVVGASVLASINIMQPEKLAESYRQLVSAIPGTDGQPRCLEANRDEARQNTLPSAAQLQQIPDSGGITFMARNRNDSAVHFLGLSRANIHLQLAEVEGDERLPLRLAACDSEHRGQLWRYSATSGQITNKGEGFYLEASPLPSASSAANLSVQVSAHKHPEQLPAPRWQPHWQGNRLVFMYLPSRPWALSAVAGSKVGLVPLSTHARALWQQWQWQ